MNDDIENSEPEEELPVALLEEDLSLTFAMRIASKFAELNVWLESQEVSTMLTDKKVFLIGLAMGLHEKPEIKALLTPEVLQYIPPVEMGHMFVAGGINTWTRFYGKLYELNHIEALVMNEDLTYEEGVDLIRAITV